MAEGARVPQPSGLWRAGFQAGRLGRREGRDG
jgi:hypothetical protein